MQSSSTAVNRDNKSSRKLSDLSFHFSVSCCHNYRPANTFAQLKLSRTKHMFRIGLFHDSPMKCISICFAIYKDIPISVFLLGSSWRLPAGDMNKETWGYRVFYQSDNFVFPYSLWLSLSLDSRSWPGSFNKRCIVPSVLSLRYGHSDPQSCISWPVGLCKLLISAIR